MYITHIYIYIYTHTYIMYIYPSLQGRSCACRRKPAQPASTESLRDGRADFHRDFGNPVAGDMHVGVFRVWSDLWSGRERVTPARGARRARGACGAPCLRSPEVSAPRPAQTSQ